MMTMVMMMYVEVLSACLLFRIFYCFLICTIISLFHLLIGMLEEHWLSWCCVLVSAVHVRCNFL